MIGPLLDSAGIISGSLIGAVLGKRIPESLRNRLPLVFGCIAMGLGISMIVKVRNLSPVVLSLLLGTILGELLRLEKGVALFGIGSRRLVEKWLPSPEGVDHEEFMERFAAMLVLFAFSGMGIFGSITEGLTGDPTLLIVKTLLDFFTAGIFAVSLGVALAVTSIPQFLVQAALFFGGTLLVPFMTEIVMADFSAVGGFIMLATGFNICRLMQFPVISMLPAMALAMPMTGLWLRLGL